MDQWPRGGRKSWTQEDHTEKNCDSFCCPFTARSYRARIECPLECSGGTGVGMRHPFPEASVTQEGDIGKQSQGTGLLRAVLGAQRWKVPQEL